MELMWLNCLRIVFWNTYAASGRWDHHRGIRQRQWWPCINSYIRCLEIIMIWVVHGICAGRGWCEKTRGLIRECCKRSGSWVQQRWGEAKWLRGRFWCWLEIFMIMPESVNSNPDRKDRQRSDPKASSRYLFEDCGMIFPQKKKEERDQLIKRVGKRTSPPPRQHGAYYSHPMKCREREKQELAQEYGMELASADSG